MTEHRSTDAAPAVGWVHGHQVDLGGVGAVELDGRDADVDAVDGRDDRRVGVRDADLVVDCFGDFEPVGQQVEQSPTHRAGVSCDVRELDHGSVMAMILVSVRR